MQKAAGKRVRILTTGVTPLSTHIEKAIWDSPMKIKLSELRKQKFIEKVMLHSHDQSLYLVSVLLADEEFYVTDENGDFLKSFNKLELQSKFNGLFVGQMVLRHQSPYDEMIGLTEEKTDNTLEVLIGGEAYAYQARDKEPLH
jgi:hypothetical protein